jgi:hypothetical protein
VSAPCSPSEIKDARALALRCEGTSFSRIARTLGLSGPPAANAAFVRALRREPPARQRRLRNEELFRLRTMEVRARDDPGLAPFDRDRQLAVVAQLRAELLEA